MTIPTFTSKNANGYIFLAKYQPYALGREDKIAVWVEGGVPDYSWAITGSDFTLTSATTTVQYNFVTASDSVTVGTCQEITVTDADGEEVTISICCCAGDPCCDAEDYSFTFDYVNSNLLFIRGRKGRIAVKDGCPPFHWSTDDTDFTFESDYTNTRYNYLTAAIGDNGVAEVTITVTDNCGSSAYGISQLGPDGDFDFEDVDGGHVIGVPDGGTSHIWNWSCTDSGYEFYFDDETTVEINAGSSITLSITGGIPLYIWHSNNPSLLSFTAAGNNEAWKYDSGIDGTSSVTLYTESDAKSGSSTVNVSDRCLKLPIHDVGSGFVIVNVTGCCDNLPDGVFAFDDDNTPDTIVANSNIDVYVTGGCAPFTYVVSGTGYTWNADGSTSYESNDRNEQLDCASGSCGVDYAAIASLTITDLCGDSVTAKIRNTGGAWGAWTDDECKITTNDPSEYSSVGDCWPNQLCTYTSGQYQQENMIHCLTASGSFDCDTLDPPPYRCSLGGPAGSYPQCHGDSAIACADACVGPSPGIPHDGDASSCTARCTGYIRWREWGCP